MSLGDPGQFLELAAYDVRMLAKTPVEISGATSGKTGQVEIREASQAQSSSVAAPAGVTRLDQGSGSGLDFKAGVW